MLEDVQKLAIFMISILITILQVILWIPSYIYRGLILLIVKLFQKDLGTILDPIATLLDDNYTQNKANCSIISILKIKGDLNLQQVCNIFTTNVLQTKTVTAKGIEVLKYPELKQFQADYMGYRFWKQDTKFQIENHVWEAQNFKDLEISAIHEKMLNKNYPDGKSPWELVVIRNYRETKECTLLILRIHHSMADGKSVVKLLVEGLGQKQLSAATALHSEKSSWEKILFFLCLPYNLTQVNQLFLESQLKTQRHSWSVKNIHNDQSAIQTALSTKISINAIKLIAAKNKVRMSSVILLIVTNTIRSFNKRIGEACEDTFPVYCLLPKEDHPDLLKNHLYIGLPNLPVDDVSDKMRLQQCENLYNQLRSSFIPQATEVMASLVSTWVNGMRSKLTPVRAVSTVVSNIAGEEEGFNIGSLPCVDYTMTVGFRRSSIGVQFFALSYKDFLQFTVSTKASVMDDNSTKMLANMIGMECNKLINVTSVIEL